MQYITKFTNVSYIYVSNIQQIFCKPSDSLVEMEIATSCGSSWLLLGSLWTYSFDAFVDMINECRNRKLFFEHYF